MSLQVDSSPEPPNKTPSQMQKLIFTLWDPESIDPKAEILVEPTWTSDVQSSEIILKSIVLSCYICDDLLGNNGKLIQFQNEDVIL